MTSESSEEPRPVDLAEIGDAAGSSSERMSDHLLDPVRVDLSVELGRTQMSFRDLQNLVQGAIVELDRIIGEPLDIRANGHLIARGEVVGLKNDQYGIRVTELVRGTAAADSK